MKIVIILVILVFKLFILDNLLKKYRYGYVSFHAIVIILLLTVILNIALFISLISLIILSIYSGKIIIAVILILMLVYYLALKYDN